MNIEQHADTTGKSSLKWQATMVATICLTVPPPVQTTAHGSSMAPLMPYLWRCLRCNIHDNALRELPERLRRVTMIVALWSNDTLVQTTRGVVSATFGTTSHFAFYKYAPLSKQREALFPQLFGPEPLFGQRGRDWACLYFAPGLTRF